MIRYLPNKLGEQYPKTIKSTITALQYQISKSKIIWR